MPRNITVTFADGSNHVYQGAPDDVTPEQITQRAQQDFSGKQVTALDGGRKASPNRAKLRPVDARAAMDVAERELAKATQGMAPNVAADARRRMMADPRISRLQASMQGTPAPAPRPSLGAAMLDSAKSVGGNMAIGISAIPDALAAGGEMVTNTVGSALGEGGGAILEAAGARGAARKFRKLMEPRHTRTMGEMIQQTLPPDSGSGAGLAAQMLGGALVPLPGIKMPPAARIPQIMSKQAPNAAQQIVQEGEKAGIRVLTSDVKPPRTFMGKAAQTLGERIPIAGTGGVRAAQQGERIEAVKNVLTDFGADDTAAAMGDVVADLTRTRGAELRRLTAAKNAVINGLDGNVPVDRTLTVIDEQIANLTGINGTAFRPVIDKLLQFKTELASGKTLAQIEGNRKLLGDLFKDPSLAAIKGDGQKALNAIYAPLRAEMGTFISNRGGQGALTRWRAANDRLAAMAGELNSRALKSVLNDAETTPENVSKLLFSAKPSDVKRLYDGLSAQGRARAQSAVLARAMEKAGGLDNLSPDRFLGEMGRLGKQTGIVFRGADLARIEGLTRVLQATKRAAEASVAPPTGVQAMPYAMTAGLTAAFGLIKGAMVAGGTGGLARAYESAPVRNALLKLGKTAAGSKAEGIAMNRVTEVLAKAMAGPIRSVAPAANDTAPAAALAGETPEDQQGQ